MAFKKLQGPDDFPSLPNFDTSIRDNPAYVALSIREKKRDKVERKKAAVQRRLSKVQSMQKAMNEKQLEKFKEEEKTRMINILMVKTGHNEQEITEQYESFMKMCPEGVLTKRKFIDVSREVYGYKARNLSEAIFDIFDEDHSCKIDFVEYMLAINASKVNSPETKLEWIFNVFDKDASGAIDGEEINGMLKGLYALAGIEYDDGDVKRCIKEIMGVCDDDGDGEITRNEFVRNALKSTFIRSIL